MVDKRQLASAAPELPSRIYEQDQKRRKIEARWIRITQLIILITGLGLWEVAGRNNWIDVGIGTSLYCRFRFRNDVNYSHNSIRNDYHNNDRSLWKF